MIQTTNMEGALRHLSINHRKIPLLDKVLYFCDDPEHITFNLECRDDGSVHLWRFLLTDIAEKHGRKKIELTSAPGITGLEITEDNVLNFYIRESVSTSDLPEFLQSVITDFVQASVRIQEHFRYLTLQEPPSPAPDGEKAQIPGRITDLALKFKALLGSVDDDN